MALPHINPTQTEAWKKLRHHFEAIRTERMSDWFTQDPERASKFTLQWRDFLIDYSKNRITAETKTLLLNLAEQTGIKEAIDLQFRGDIINKTENRAVLHTTLRADKKPVEVTKTLANMAAFSDAVIKGEWKGYSGKAITDIVNIGIGGSDLGPKMATEALQFYHNHLNIHFISNIDSDQNAELCRILNPETTLFIIVSKSFSTQETLNNAKWFRKWFLKKSPKKGMSYHFVAVSSNVEQANKFGITKKNIFPMWDWVGGRFSLWSAVGLSLCCAIGYANFERFLQGAQEMDQHFKNTPLDENIPVLLALLSVWYNNFFDAETEAVIPYTNYLDSFVPYLQQAFMESNGKSVSRNGKRIDYQTGTVVWGAAGTNAQHAFFQLIHQGTKLIPCDFIGFKHCLHEDQKDHHKLMANFFAQTKALLQGKSEQQVFQELDALTPKEQQELVPFKFFEGNKPTTTFLIDKLTPESLGSLIAMYEHKIFVQGIIWNVYSYDQWGVELGKELATAILDQFKTKDFTSNNDSSTANLLTHYFKE